MRPSPCDVCWQPVCEHPRRCERARIMAEERIRRFHVRDDEQPDLDFDPDGDAAFEREAVWADGHCERCGVAGHVGDECPTVTPALLRSTP